MPVYFIQAGDGGPIKIGFAHDVARRLRALQTATWLPLSVIGSVEGGERQERALHQSLRKWLIAREWFHPAPAVLDAMNDPPPPLPPVTPVSGEHWSIIEVLAAELGASNDALKQWKRRGVPGRHHLPLMRLAEQRGIALPDEALRSGCARPDAGGAA